MAAGDGDRAPPGDKAPPGNKGPPRDKGGLRSLQTTSLFRALNPELFIRPVRLSTPTTWYTHLRLFTPAQGLQVMVSR